MKAFYIPTALLAAILCFSLWVGHFIKEQGQVWEENLLLASQHAHSENWAKATDCIRAAYTNWNEHRFLFYTVMDHADLDQTQALFAGTLAACTQQDREEFHILLAQLSLQLQLVAEKQIISIENIL